MKREDCQKLIHQHGIWFHKCRVIQNIFQRVDEHIDNKALLNELNLSAVPNLYARFVQLIERLVIILKLVMFHFLFDQE